MFFIFPYLSGLGGYSEADDRAAAKLVADAAAAEANLGREFTTSEREAIEAYNKVVRGEERSRDRADTVLAEKQQTDERLGAEAFARAEAVLNRALTVSERQAIQAFQQSEREASEQTAAGAATLAENRAIADREDRQAQETAERQATQGFNMARDKLNFDRESKLESVRLGIADATSPEGIARAVELADEARALEKAETMLNVIEQISSGGFGRQLADSGVLEQLAEQFGVDLDFLIRGGLGGGFGGGGGSQPVRVTA